MKILESRPERYDLGMSLLTLGALTKIKQQIAEHTHPGNRVLDLGCGTGTLAQMCIERGAQGHACSGKKKFSYRKLPKYFFE